MQKHVVQIAVCCCTFICLMASAAHAQPYAVPPTTIPAFPRKPVTSPFADKFPGKAVLVLLYSINNPRAGEAVEFLRDMAKIKNEHNFEIVGVNINPDQADAAARFNKSRDASFLLVTDKSGELAKNMNFTGELSLYIFNKKGGLMGSIAAENVPTSKKLGQSFRAYVNRILKTGFVPSDEPVLGDRPPAPPIDAEDMYGAKVSLRQLCEKSPVVLVIFSPMCSHCRDELLFLQDQLRKDFKDKFTVLAVSRYGKEVTEKFINEHGFSFPVLLDTDNAITARFESFVGVVPVAYLINKDGRIYARHVGFSDRVRDIYLMELRKLTGIPGKPQLAAKGYSGQDRCEVCHEREHLQWSLTGHAYAFGSLQRKGREDDPACVSCHVTGWGRAGGYSLEDKVESRALEGVQCESCHGPGNESCTAYTGAPAKKKTAQEWKELCVTCHTDQQSLNFNFARRFPKVLHGSMPDISKMSRSQRIALLQEHREKSDLFSNPASYVGAGACKACHEPEYQQWSLTAHASAGRSLAAEPADKKYRFVTGAGHPGGYPAPDRLGVQCEACHGPGGRHVKEPNKKGQEYIVGLGGQCESCVVEQICRNCHGPADDPDFTFEKALELVRHKPRN